LTDPKREERGDEILRSGSFIQRLASSKQTRLLTFEANVLSIFFRRFLDGLHGI